MKVREVMTERVECTRPDDTIQQAARRMKELNVGTLPVCGESDRLVGMITDRDIAIRAVAEGKSPAETRVRDAMTPDVIFCFDDSDVDQVADLMRENQVRRVVVLNKDKRLAGIVSLGDLAVGTGGGELAGDTLEGISEPVHQTKR